MTRTTISIAAAMTLSLALVATADARPRKRVDFRTEKSFGLGLMVGAPTGLSGKYYTEGDVAFAFGLGEHNEFHDRYNDDLHVHFDVLWHPVVLTQNDSLTLPLHVGVGGQFFDGDHRHGGDFTHDESGFGVRVPFGLTLDFRKIPMDVFFELTFSLNFYDDDDFHDHDRTDLNGALGARYYF